MAKHKGKSQRRIKDWHQRYEAGQEDDGTVARRQKLSQRAVKLPPSRAAAPEENLDTLPKTNGMVVGQYPGGVVVRTGIDELLCGIAKTFRAPEGSSPLAVGDDVTLALTQGHHADASKPDMDRADGMILTRGPRETLLARPQPRSGKHRDAYETETFTKVIAANIDVLLIVAATRRPPLSHGPIDRFLIIAERGELEPVLAVNKLDLGRPEGQTLGELEALDIDVFFCSALTGEGIEALRSALGQKRVVLAGASGVGKSAMINALVPGADAATRSIREKSQRGRHTTSAAVVYNLPKGGMLIDTPGIRELGTGLNTAELTWYFREFDELSPRCRFNNCTHTHEPDCAVAAAVERGEILRRRYESYLRILETLEET